MSATDALLERVAARRALPPPEMRRALRKSARLTFVEIGEAMVPPVSRQLVGLWESGDRVPRPDHLTQYAALLEALRVELDPREVAQHLPAALAS